MDGRVQVDDVGGRFDRVKVSRQSLQDTQKNLSTSVFCWYNNSNKNEVWSKMECLSNYFIPFNITQSFTSFKPPL